MERIWKCCLTEDEVEQKIKSKKIDHELSKEKHQLRRQVKLLLLGAGESGKSTFLKQLKIIHGETFKEQELEEFKIIIYTNIIKAMRVLIDAREKLMIPWFNEENGKLAMEVFAFEGRECPDYATFFHYVHSIMSLWSDRGIQAAYCRRNEYGLTYFPSTQDVLYCRKPTKGVHEHHLTIKGIPFLIVDVGGQRSQRAKWFHCFDMVTSIIFLVSSSAFDQTIMEDHTVNVLVESSVVFDTVVNHKLFASVSFILFLNKTDLLEEKIKHMNIKDYFPDFSGRPTDLAAVQSFILDMFDSKRRDQSRPLFHHFTTAVSTENIKLVFDVVRDTILRENLKVLMLQ